MGSVSDVLRVAAGEVGYYRHNDPLSGTKYGRWYAERMGAPWFGTNGVPYCAMFVSWVLDQAGVSVPGLPTAYCPSIKAAGAGALVPATEARPGDIALFDWDGDSDPDHVGIVEANNGSYLTTIEGNTSRGDAGSQGNGGWVARRERPLSVVDCVVRPAYSGEWVRVGGRWWYRHADGSFTSDGWEMIGGSWFLFDASGWMLTGWQSVGGRWYYLCEEEGHDLGRMLVGWQRVSGRWYYMDPATGAMATDWVREGGRWYWLDPATGAMVASGVREVGGRAYAFGEDGAMLEGELTFLTDEGGALVRKATVEPEGASDGRA